jgi:TonB-dependent starch-binding outer membrane protein SusC
MKKNLNPGGISTKIPPLLKLFITMKLTTILVSLVSLNLSFGNSYAQETRLSLHISKGKLLEVFKNIESQSEFSFMYDNSMVNVEKEVNIKVEKRTINEVLDQVLDKNEIRYQIIDRHIVLIPVASGRFVDRTVTGTVISVEDNQGLPGVNVILKGSSLGTVTDINGNFSLSIPEENAVLVFSSVGFLEQEVLVGNLSVLNVTMALDVKSLDEIVVIGYGTVKKSDLTGAVSVMDNNVIDAVPVFNMEQALKVGAAGVRVTQNSGAPGGRIEVRIRGSNSMVGDNQPLYVVDGFPVNGDISFLNPADIESVNILKDASATAIYGSRGANGVVIITSKRGKTGQQGRIDFDASYGIQQEINRYDLLGPKDYAIIANEWLKNGNQAPYFNVDDVEEPGTDWQDVIFRSAPIQNYTLTFSGSSDKTNYSFSGNYFDQVGILINSGTQRGSARINLDHELNKWFKMGVNLQISRRSVQSVNVDNGNRGNSMLSAAASAPPTLPVYNEDGLPYQIEQEYNFGSADMRNPLIWAQRKDNRIVTGILANTTFDVIFSPNLVFRTLIGLQTDNGLRETFVPIIYDNDRGSASESNTYSNSFLNENTLTFSKTYNDVHNFSILGGYTYQTSMFRNSSISVSGFSNNITENYDLSAAENIGNPSSGYSEWTLASFLSRANYSYKGKYMITASIRADGSSRFGADHKWGYFPSGAVAWNVGDEAFMDGLGIISALKLRTSYGITGNTGLNPYQSLNRLSSVKFIYGNHADVIGYVPTGIANSDLRWETTAQTDIGFDLELLDSRLRFVFDYYRKDTKDLLASVPLPPSVGFGSSLQNLGEIRNTGVEFSLDADILVNEFKWDISTQISINKNEVVKIAGDSDIFGAEQSAVWPTSNIARVGEPFGAFFGLLEDGLDESGFIKYKDLSGPEGVPDGIVNTLDRVILGSYYPDFIYGFTSNFAYKNFEFNVIIEGVNGVEIFNATDGTHLNSFQRGNNQFNAIMGNYWTAENPDPNAKYPKISSATQITVSDRFIEDGSYLRFRSLRLAYNLPVRELGISFLSRMQVYISGNNLFTFTKYTGLDPEVSTRGNDSQNVQDRLRIGHDQSSYPNAKIYSAGLKLSF